MVADRHKLYAVLYFYQNEYVDNFSLLIVFEKGIISLIVKKNIWIELILSGALR